MGGPWGGMAWRRPRACTLYGGAEARARASLQIPARRSHCRVPQAKRLRAIIDANKREQDTYNGKQGELEEAIQQVGGREAKHVGG